MSYIEFKEKVNDFDEVVHEFDYKHYSKRNSFLADFEYDDNKIELNDCSIEYVSEEEMFRLAKILIKKYDDVFLKMFFFVYDDMQSRCRKILYQDNKVYFFDYYGYDDSLFECPECRYHTFGNYICELIEGNQFLTTDLIDEHSFFVSLKDIENRGLMEEIIVSLNGILTTEDDAEYVICDEEKDFKYINVETFFKKFIIENTGYFEYDGLYLFDDIRPFIYQNADVTNYYEVCCPNCKKTVGVDVLSYVIPKDEFMLLKKQCLDRKYFTKEIDDKLIFDYNELTIDEIDIN